MMFEFIVATVIFLAVVMYTINYLSSSVSAVSGDFRSNSMHIKAIQLTELLVKNGGVWDSGTPDVVGLASDSGWPVLSSKKINDLQAYCGTEEGYNELAQDKLGFGVKNYMKINIRGESSLLDCGPEVPEGTSAANARRFALSESGDVLLVDVWLW